MLVGVMSTYIRPPKLIRITALISKAYGIDIIFVRPPDVNIEKETLTGKMLINNKWVTQEREIPDFIDITPYCFKKKYKPVTDYLKEKTFLSDNRDNILTKEALHEYLREDPKYAHLVLPTHNVSTYDDILNYLDQYSKVVLKPSDGIQGKRIYIVEKTEDKYKVGHNTLEKNMSEDEFFNLFIEKIENQRYLVQKYIVSRTLQGDPFDCRIHVEKNGSGKWQSAKNYIRIGIGQKVISNVNQGGGIADPIPFLKANYGGKWKEIDEKLKKLAVTLPYKIEELRGTHIMSLGIDIGIGRDGELYLFEVNDGPAFKSLIGEIAYLRSNYYKYIQRNIIGINNSHDVSMKNDADKAPGVFKKSLKQIKNIMITFKSKYKRK
ncbi:YheC/YheD family protein [Lacicoccus qingdaonensis]|uniref:YheC/D like ATP-grasp n=1 Tax=Lacicoccus qingdaonensis TaxID=576118 RepID=A0A1G9F6H1_9BACL|nr:YheC/YheD family protein [Salinicoccus qingdaonensis]SDK83930.1 YheC/D like ATP-grasp [Salinicoccus qingdaonensis]